MTGAPRLELRLLGRSAVLRDGAEIPPTDFGGRKVRTLLRILGTRQGAFVGYDALGEMLWPDRQPANLPANIQVLTNRARQAVGGLPLIRTLAGGYALEPEPHCVVDATRFAVAVRRARELDGAAALPEYLAALRLWTGDPLPEDLFADWAGEFRGRMLLARQTALERAAQLALDAGDAALAVELASAAVDAEPLREVAALTLVRALSAAGDDAAALVRYDAYRRALAEDLGVDPSPDAARLYRRLLAGERPGPAESTSRPSGPAHRPRPARRSTAFGELPFVGRESDLRAILDRVAGPDGCTVTVAGTSGTGKSRLLREAASRVPSATARATPAERAEPWSLIRSLLRDVLAQDVAFRDALPPRIGAALPALLPELDPIDTAEPDVDAESRRALLQEATVRLLDTAGLVIVLDDLQWADPTSVALVGSARARLPDLRLVLAFRSDEIAGAPAAQLLDHVRPDLRITPPALPRAAIDALVTDATLADVLADHTDRTPMAITEVLRGLASESRVAATADGRWRTVDPAAADRARQLGADGQRHTILRRANREPPERREILDLVGILGRQAPVPLLAATVGATDAQVLDRLAGLHRSGLVRPGESGWVMTHDMIADVLADELDPARAARLHAAAAAANESLDGDPAERADHWRRAGDGRRATAAYAVAAQRALDDFADHEAIALADAGLRLEPHPSVAATLREIRAQARGRTGDIGGARADLRAALAVERAGPRRARILGRLALLASGADDLHRAAELAELALVEAGTDTPAVAQALEIAAMLDMNLNRPDRSRARSGRALELYRLLGDASGTARVLDEQAMATFLGGDVRAGGRALRRVADLFEDSGDLVRVVTPRSTAGHALVFAGQASEGLRQASAALDLARTLGHPEGQAYALWHRTEALAALDRTGEATADAREALAIATRIGHRGWTATSYRALGVAAHAAGDLDAALDAFTRSLASSEHLDLFASWAASRLALVHLAQGGVDDAGPLVSRALALGPPLGHYEARLAEAELAAATHRPDAAALARRALDLATAGGVRQGTRRLSDIAHHRP